MKTYYGKFAVTYNYGQQAGNTSTKLTGIKVAGNHIVNQQGKVVSLRVSVIIGSQWD